MLATNHEITTELQTSTLLQHQYASTQRHSTPSPKCKQINCLKSLDARHLLPSTEKSTSSAWFPALINKTRISAVTGSSPVVLTPFGALDSVPLRAPRFSSPSSLLLIIFRDIVIFRMPMRLPRAAPLFIARCVVDGTTFNRRSILWGRWGVRVILDP